MAVETCVTTEETGQEAKSVHRDQRDWIPFPLWVRSNRKGQKNNMEALLLLKPIERTMARFITLSGVLLIGGLLVASPAPAADGKVQAALATRPVTLVEKGRATAVIVIPAGNNSSEAVHLQRYVEKVSGAKLDIVTEDQLPEAKRGARVFVGPCLATSRVVDIQGLGPEGFVIKTEGNDLFIVGRDTTATGLKVAGTFYGVCEFLERYLGVRWLMPGPVGEVAPKQATIEIASANIRQEPMLCMRGNASQRVAANQASNAGSWSAYQRLGSRVKVSTGHAFAGWWDKYHEQYPDIFAMQPNGTRMNTNERERLCESNPTLWQLVAQEKIKELRANPDLLAVSISENDGGPNHFCNCERCRSWDAPEIQELFKKEPRLYSIQRSDLISDRVYRFYNEVAKLVQQELPDRYVSGYAYSTYQAGPVRDFPDHCDHLIIGYVGFDAEEYPSSESPFAAHQPSHHLRAQAGRRPAVHGRPRPVGGDLWQRRRRQLGDPGPELLCVGQAAVGPAPGRGPDH
jgi:hypothetical protein